MAGIGPGMEITGGGAGGYCMAWIGICFERNRTAACAADELLMSTQQRVR